MAITGEAIGNSFAKTVKDNFLYQLGDFLTREDNILDLLLTNFPDKIVNVQGFEDILVTDHKHISFQIDLQIKKLPKVKRTIYNLRNANWTVLKVPINPKWEIVLQFG